MSRPQFQAPRGTSDILPSEQAYWKYFYDNATKTASKFGYERIDTPAFEDSNLFIHGVGEITDIVEKETYTFEDRGGDLITLRPEGTAPVCRAYMQNGMQNLPQPVRLYYFCPVFRYERPQSGRLREHHQFGLEIFGGEDSTIDSEIIEFAWEFLKTLGLKKLSLTVNSIGDSACRPDYIGELRNHYQSKVAIICTDCNRRLKENPLRLLDCKQESCQPIIASAPHSINHLCDECSQHWNKLLENLDLIGLPYEIDHKLVRGFDYYTRTVFEIVPPTKGRQNTIVGGGRYDGLMEQLGGRPTPGIGFGMGIERVINNLKTQQISIPGIDSTRVLVTHVGEEAQRLGLLLSTKFRRNEIPAIFAPAGRSLKSQLKYASSIKATHAVIIGDSEISRCTFILRDLINSTQEEINEDDMITLLKSL